MDTNIAWTGGGTTALTELTEPRDFMAFRPHIYKDMAKVEKECKTGLLEAFHLALPDQISAKESKYVSFKTWVNLIKQEMELRGMDPVFRVQDATGAEIYLLEEFKIAKVPATVKKWVEDLLAGRIGNRAAPCPHDKRNLAMSGVMIQNSLTTDMLRKMHHEGALPGTSGPEMLAAIVRCHQALSAGAVREMSATLRAMKLAKEPAENVDTFVDKVSDLGKRIEGTGRAPDDLKNMIYETLSGCSNSEFAYMVSILNVKAGDEEDNSVDDWEFQLTKLKGAYRDMKQRGLWEASQTQKEHAAMKAAIKKLETKSTSTSEGTSKKSDDRECYHCGKKGHIKPNCPDKDTPKDQLKKGGSSTSAPSGTSSVKKTPPKEGESNTKSIEGASHKWCATCKRWNTGDKAHFTADHRKGAGKAPSAAATEPAVAGALAATDDSYPSLRLIGGYMASMTLKDQAGQF